MIGDQDAHQMLMVGSQPMLLKRRNGDRNLPIKEVVVVAGYQSLVNLDMELLEVIDRLSKKATQTKPRIPIHINPIKVHTIPIQTLINPPIKTHIKPIHIKPLLVRRVRINQNRTPTKATSNKGVISKARIQHQEPTPINNNRGRFVLNHL